MRPFLALLALCVALSAQDAAPSPEHLRDLLDQLGSEEIAKRDAAQKELEGLGKAALPAVEAERQATSDAEVRQRCEAILAHWEERWEGLLVEGVGSDGFQKALQAVWDDVGAFDKALLADEGYARCAIDPADDLLTEPCRFFVVRGEVFGVLSRPRYVLLVCVRENGEAFPVNMSLRRYDGLAPLRPLLRPAETPEARLRVASLVAHATELCLLCHDRDAVTFDSASAVSEDAGEGRTRVSFSAASFAPNTDEQTVAVTFDASGRVLEATSTSRGGHR